MKGTLTVRCAAARPVTPPTSSSIVVLLIAMISRTFSPNVPDAASLLPTAGVRARPRRYHPAVELPYLSFEDRNQCRPEFIPAAESTGLILRIGDWVIVAAGGEVSGGGEVGAVSGLHCRVAQARGDVGFADSGRADQQHVRRGLEVAAGAELGE